MKPRRGKLIINLSRDHVYERVSIRIHWISTSLGSVAPYAKSGHKLQERRLRGTRDSTSGTESRFSQASAISEPGVNLPSTHSLRMRSSPRDYWSRRLVCTGSPRRAVAGSLHGFPARRMRRSRHPL